jgi:hypothetical protein
MVKEGDDFLSFAHSEDGHEDGATAFEGGANGGEEFLFKVCAILARDGGLSATGCFHNQGIERAGGSLAREHEGLALEIEVAGVEGAAFFGADFGKDRTEDVAGIMKDKLQFGGGVGAEGAIEGSEFPSDGGVVHRAVSIERVIHAAQFPSLAGHDIDRIMQKGFGQCGGG